MRLIINGTPQEVPTVVTLPELLTVLNLPQQTLLVELNGVALHRREWEECPISEGDALEFLTIAAGG
jgi:thiamine biosynthesis protein ThiS